MTNDPPLQMICPSCGGQNPPKSRFCCSCGAVLVGGGLNRTPPRPGSLSGIAACGILTAAIAIYCDPPWSAPMGPHDAYYYFIQTFNWLGLPLNILLLIACCGLFGRGKAWAKQGMLWWSGLIVIFESVQLLVAVMWIAPRATAADLGLTDLGDIKSLLGSDYSQNTMAFEYSVYWISMISLAVWAWWVLRKPANRAFFEPQDASSTPQIS